MNYEDPEDLVDAVIAGDPNGLSETYLEVMKSLEEKLMRLKEKRDNEQQ